MLEFGFRGDLSVLHCTLWDGGLEVHDLEKYLCLLLPAIYTEPYEPKGN